MSASSPARQTNRLLTAQSLGDFAAQKFSHVVVGSGMGGMTCAAVLARAGHKVLLLEQHYQIGGCTHEFEKGDYEFDVGLHYVGQEIWKPDALSRKLFDHITMGKVKWTALDKVYDKTTVDGQVYDIPAGREEVQSHFKKLFPDSAREIAAYFADVQVEAAKIGKDMIRRVGMAYLPGVAVDKMFPLDPTFGQETVDQALDRLGVVDPKLRKVLTYCWVVEHYMEGAAYPIGGPATIAAAVIETIEQCGGHVASRARVSSIQVTNGRASGVFVQFGDSEKLIPCENVVSAVGAYNTYVRLLSSEVCAVNPELDLARKALVSGSLPISPSHAMTFIALKGTSKELGLPNCNFWVQDAKDFPFVFISFPSSRDPTYADRYPGVSTCEIVVESNYMDFEPWANGRDEAYQVLKEDMSNRALAVLFDKFPHLKDKVVFCAQSTPLTAAKYLGSEHGCTYGIACTPSRFAAPWLNPCTALPGLFLTGQDVSSCGIVGALMGGAMTSMATSVKAVWGLRSLFQDPSCQ